MQLGLVDGVGILSDILKEKFGKDVKIKKFEKPQGFLQRKLSGSNIASDFMDEIEVRAMWNRYGL